MQTRVPNPEVMQELRDRISSLEGSARRRAACLAFDIPEMDAALPGGGLAHGALHEFAGGGSGTVDGAAPALCVAGIVARTKGPVIWCLTRNDLHAPALAQVGLHPDRVIFVESDNEEGVQASMEEALAYGGMGAVVGELVRMPMVVSRRLQLAAEKTGTMGLVIRRWRRQSEASDYGQPTASTTRWRVSSLPSVALPVPGVGRARWLLELMRSRSGGCAEFEVLASDGTGQMAIGRDDRGAERHDRRFAV